MQRDFVCMGGSVCLAAIHALLLVGEQHDARAAARPGRQGGNLPRRRQRDGHARSIVVGPRADIPGIEMP